MRTKTKNFCGEASGSLMVAAALGIVALLGVAALALDIGHMLSIKNELQRAADAGALAGARALWPGTLPIVSNPPQPDCATAQSTARGVSASANNKVNGAILTISQVTVQTGRWDYPSQAFTPGTGPNVNAVRVITQTPATMFFAQVLGIGSRNVSATATALADFALGVGKGTLPIVIGQPFVSPGESIFINFTPDTMDNGAWFAYSSDPASAKTFKDYLDNATCPPLNVGDLVNLQNGQDTSVLHDLQNKLAQQGGVWDVVLPVVNVTQFVGSAPITGFVAFEITQVVDSGGNKGIIGTFLGMYMSNTSSPGGSNFGVLSPPKLL